MRCENELGQAETTDRPGIRCRRAMGGVDGMATGMKIAADGGYGTLGAIYKDKK